jgi:hypothetical protein
MSSSNKKTTSGGFSLLELLIAMVITMALMTAASTLLANALRVRSRENQKSDALADTQRALNIMSREIANAGFNMTGNGIVAADSGLNEIRVRSNLNRYDYDPLSYCRIASQRSGCKRRHHLLHQFSRQHDVPRSTRSVRNRQHGAGEPHRRHEHSLLRSESDLHAPPGGSDITGASAPEVSPANAKYIVIAISVTLDAVGQPGSPVINRLTQFCCVQTSHCAIQTFGVTRS